MNETTIVYNSQKSGYLAKCWSLIQAQGQARVVYHLPQKSGNFGWNVNGQPILVFPNGKFPEKPGFLER